MKKTVLSLPVLILLLLTGCGAKLKLPDAPVIFATKDNGEYMSLIWGDKEYVPFCALDPKDLGDCIGYYEYEGSKVFVCKLKGQSETQWLVDVLSLDNCNEGMVFKEKNTIKIPDGMSSDYKWNK